MYGFSRLSFSTTTKQTLLLDYLIWPRWGYVKTRVYNNNPQPYLCDISGVVYKCHKIFQLPIKNIWNLSKLCFTKDLIQPHILKSHNIICLTSLINKMLFGTFLGTPSIYAIHLSFILLSYSSNRRASKSTFHSARDHRPFQLSEFTRLFTICCFRKNILMLVLEWSLEFLYFAKKA